MWAGRRGLNGQEKEEGDDSVMKVISCDGDCVFYNDEQDHDDDVGGSNEDDKYENMDQYDRGDYEDDKIMSAHLIFGGLEETEAHSETASLVCLVFTCFSNPKGKEISRFICRPL